MFIRVKRLIPDGDQIITINMDNVLYWHPEDGSEKVYIKMLDSVELHIDSDSWNFAVANSSLNVPGSDKTAFNFKS